MNVLQCQSGCTLPQDLSEQGAGLTDTGQIRGHFGRFPSTLADRASLGVHRDIGSDGFRRGKSRLQRIRGQSSLRWLPFVHLQFVRQNIHGAGQRAGDGQPHAR